LQLRNVSGEALLLEQFNPSSTIGFLKHYFE